MVKPEDAARGGDARPAGDRSPPPDPARTIANGEGEPGSGPSMPKTALRHDSALADYVPYEETDGPSWIEANERVGEIGGWREYARELFESTPVAADGEDGR